MTLPSPQAEPWTGFSARTRSPCRSPGPSAPKSPAFAPRPRRTWSGPGHRRGPRDRLYARGLRRRQHRYDVILDIGGNNGLSHLRRALPPRGRLVMVGGESGGRWLGEMDRLLRAHLLFPLVNQKLSTFIASENSADLKVLRDLIESGKITPGHRPGLPAKPDPGGHPARPGRPRPRQGRHHHPTGCLPRAARTPASLHDHRVLPGPPLVGAGARDGLVVAPTLRPVPRR